MATECGQCLDPYNVKENIPRICNSCGHSVCQRCLSSIFAKEDVYKCPYCKNSNKALWTQNQSLLSMIEASSQNKC